MIDELSMRVLVIVFSGILWLFSIYVQYKNKIGTLRLILRTIYSFLGILGLVLLVFKPLITVKKEFHSAMVMTEGVPLDEEKSTIEKVLSDHIYYTIYDFLSDEESKFVDTLYIKGIGLEEAVLPLLPSFVLVDVYNINSSGIEELIIPEVNENQAWNLKGRTSGNIKWVNITSPIDERFNVEIKEDASFNIVLPGIVSGRYLYTLKMGYSDHDTSVIDLPIVIKKSPQYSLLSLLSAPSFEVNYFKNYWTSLGHQYGQRIQITEKRFVQSFTNRNKTDLSTIESTDLKSIDFVLCDIHSWNSLSKKERNLILRQVSNKGMALLFLPEEEVSPSDVPNFSFSKITEVDYTVGESKTTLLQYNSIAPNWRKIELAQTNLLYLRNMGTGHLGFLTFENTYQLLLADRVDDYQNLWSEIMSSVFIEIDVPYIIDLPSLIWEEEEISFVVHSDQVFDSAAKLNDSIDIPLMNNPFIPRTYYGKLWPDKGWNKLQFSKKKPFWFYVFPKSQLKPIRHNRNVRRYEIHNAQVVQAANKEMEVPISNWWAYALVLIGWGLLWLDERLYE